MKIIALDHFVLRTADLDAMLSFYTSVLNLQQQEKNGRISVGFGHRKINFHPPVTSITPVARRPQPGSAVFGLYAQGNPEVAAARLKAAGVASEIVSFDGFEKRLTCKDPDGNHLTLFFPAPSDAPFQITDIFSLQINVTRFLESLRFYQEVLTLPSDCQSSWLSVGPHFFSLCPEDPSSAVFGNMDFCLLTDTPVAEVKAQLEADGFEIELGIVSRNGAAGALESIYLRDPDGNLVEISNVVA